MDKSFKTKAIIGAVIAAVAIAGFMFAKGPCHGKGGPPHHEGGPCKHLAEFAKEGFKHDGLPPYLEDVELTSQQKEQISTLVKQEKSSFESHHQQRNALMKELRTLTNAQTFNEAQAEEVASKLATLEKEAFMNKAKNGHQVFSLLTPEQRQKANENIQKHMAKMDNLKGKPVNFPHEVGNFHNKING